MLLESAFFPRRNFKKRLKKNIIDDILKYSIYLIFLFLYIVERVFSGNIFIVVVDSSLTRFRTVKPASKNILASIFKRLIFVISIGIKLYSIPSN